MARRMRDKDFRDDQWARRYTGRVERINRFIDEIGAKDDAGHPPYIPPVCGGVDALALSISRDPGPKVSIQGAPVSIGFGLGFSGRIPGARGCR
jgi:hypothetical protein